MDRTRIWILAAAATVAFNLSATEWFVDRTRPDDSGNGQSVAVCACVQCMVCVCVRVCSVWCVHVRVVYGMWCGCVF